MNNNYCLILYFLSSVSSKNKKVILKIISNQRARYRFNALKFWKTIRWKIVSWKWPLKRVINRKSRNLNNAGAALCRCTKFQQNGLQEGKFSLFMSLCRTRDTWRMCFFFPQSYINDTSWIKFIPDVRVKNRD